jgi:hypothetical protein
VQDVGVDRRVLALHAQAGPRLDDGAFGQPLERLSADQHAADRREAFEPRAGVDRVADHRVRDVAVAADLAHDGLAAVDADAHPWPIRMYAGQIGEGALQRRYRDGLTGWWRAPSSSGNGSRVLATSMAT